MMCRPARPNAGYLLTGWGKFNAPGNSQDQIRCCFIADDRAYSGVLGVSIGNGCLAGISLLVEVKVEGRKVLGTTIRHDVEPC